MSKVDNLSGAEIIWESLLQEDVSVVFGYPGGTIMPTYDAMAQYPIHHVLVRHEQAAAHMADGYSRASGKVGVAIATSGPGATNLVTGIANAMLDSIPIVCITGQVSSSLLGTDAFQEIDITGVTLPITKHNYLVTKAEDIGPTIQEAFHIARTGRPGPVVVDITKDAQQASCPYTHENKCPSNSSSKPSPLSILQLEEAAELINNAERPIILAGQGVLLAEATLLLKQLVNQTDIPVAHTLLGLGGFPASHPNCLGMMGMHGNPWTNKATQEADLIIALGMRFDDRVTGNIDNYALKAKKIHIELDSSEVNKNVKVDLPIIGNLLEVLSGILPKLKPRQHPLWKETIETFRRDSCKRDIQNLPADGLFHAAHVIQDIYNITGGKATIVTDVGQHQMWVAQYYKNEHPRQLITSGGLGTMGFALPAAIGARFALPKEEIWVIAGDGGFQMTAAELSTVAQEGIKLNIAVINNGYLGMVRQWQELFFDKRYVSTPMRGPNFVKLAEAHGLQGFRVTKRDNLEAVVTAARYSPHTVVVDFQVEREDIVYPMVSAGAALDNMIRRPTQ